MANSRYRYPTGARPLLLEETARRRRIESRIVATLEGSGFAEVILPIIDFAEPYEGLTARKAARQSYRFVDRDGDLVSVRSDFTPMVARALAPALPSAALPLKVFYRGDVVRCEATRLGANRELFQIGAEVVGDGSPAADAAILRLAADLVEAFGMRPLVVYTDASIVTRLCLAGGEEVREALATKRAASGLPPLASRLISGSATLDDVRAIAPEAAARLEEIACELADDPRFVLQLDDAETVASYYTGLRFRVYGRDPRTRVAQGGRYDDLYARFGPAAPAVGFTFTVDELED